MFILLNQMCNSEKPIFLKTNPCLSLINMPSYIYELSLLKKKDYLKNDKYVQHVMFEKNITTKNKRCYLCLNVLQKIYNSLEMNRPMVVAISLAFDELPYITNNVGLIIINYDITDTIETLDEKIKNASYQAYCSNFIVNCPLPNLPFRNYIDCIISSMYIKSDYDFKIAWNCAKTPVEQMYVGTISVLRSDGTMDINMCFNTCSSNYSNKYECIDNFFE